MLSQHTHAPQSPRHYGVGIDTSRYGHYAAFLRDDLQPAAAELPFPESAAGYGLLRQCLERIVQRHGPVHFVVRLATPAPDRPASAAPFLLTISCGDPQRNKNYRAALFGSQKSDPVEARAAARFALTERPPRVRPLSLEW